MQSKRLNTPIFVFEDYIDFLLSWYSYARRFGLTQHDFLKKAGIGAGAFLSDVLARRKKIGEKHVQGFVSALELSGDEAEYFSLLVRKNNTRDPYKKELLIRDIAALRKRNFSVMLAGGGTVEYFSSWIYPVLREYITGKGSAVSAKELRKAFLYFKPQLAEIQRALKKLCDWGMISYDDACKGYCPSNDQNIVTYKEMPHAVVNDVKRSLIESAIHSMEMLPKDERHISMAIRGMRKETFKKFCARIDELRREFLELDQVSGATNDNVYSLTMQLFPVMNIRNGSTGKAGEQ